MSHSQALHLEGEGGETDGGLFQRGAGQQTPALALYHHLQQGQQQTSLKLRTEKKCMMGHITHTCVVKTVPFFIQVSFKFPA